MSTPRKQISPHNLESSFILSIWQSAIRLTLFFSISRWSLDLLGTFVNFILRRSGRKDITYGWVEIEVLVWTAAAGVALCLTTELKLSSSIVNILFILALLRLAEILIIQIDMTLFSTYQGQAYPVRSLRRTAILAIHNYIEIIIWFAFIYAAKSADFFTPPNTTLNHLSTSLYFSAVVMTTLGLGDIYPSSSHGRYVTAAHTVIGVFMSIVVFARMIGQLPRIDTFDSDETEGGIADRGPDEAGEQTGRH